MTRDEIKEMYNMRDVLALYRLQPDRKGFIHCPFHRGDRDASMNETSIVLHAEPMEIFSRSLC